MEETAAPFSSLFKISCVCISDMMANLDLSGMEKDLQSSLGAAHPPLHVTFVVSLDVVSVTYRGITWMSHEKSV